MQIINCVLTLFVDFNVEIIVMCLSDDIYAIVIIVIIQKHEF